MLDPTSLRIYFSTPVRGLLTDCQMCVSAGVMESSGADGDGEKRPRIERRSSKALIVRGRYGLALNLLVV